jgi:hypothetical protein
MTEPDGREALKERRRKLEAEIIREQCDRRRKTFADLWQEYEAELTKLYALGNRASEDDRLRIELLELAQDRIEYKLGAVVRFAEADWLATIETA